MRTMVEASGPVVLDDTTNFRVRCIDQLPLLMAHGDSLLFEATLLSGDGEVHRTDIHFRTSNGPASLRLEMIAPYAECTVSDPVAHIVELGHPHPNPANNKFTVAVDGTEPGATLEFYSLSTGVICSEAVNDQHEFTFFVQNIPEGTYFVGLRAGKSMRGISMVVISH